MVRDTEPWLIVAVALRVLEEGEHLGLPEPRVELNVAFLWGPWMFGADLVEQWLGAVSWRAQPVAGGTW